jgi:hypothetical protein
MRSVGATEVAPTDGMRRDQPRGLTIQSPW